MKLLKLQGHCWVSRFKAHTKRSSVKYKVKLSFASPLLAAALLMACSGEGPDALLESAKGFLGKKDRKGALIQLKSAIQKNGNFSEARFLLAQTLSELGDQEGALIELNKAAQLGYPDEQVMPLEARILIQQSEMDKVVRQFGSTVLKSATARADLAASLAIAYSSLGRLPEARVSVDAGLKDAPSDVRLRLVDARLKAAEGQPDVAFTQLQAIAAEHPERSDVLLLKGEFLEHRGESKEAVAAYREAAERDEANYIARSRAISLLIREQDFKQAQLVWDGLHKRIPNNLNTAYFGVLLAFEKNDLKLAEDRLMPLLKRAPDSGKVLYLAGAVFFQKGAMTQAETYLSKAISTELGESSAGVRILLARVLIRIGNPARAMALVQPLLDAAVPDPEALAVAAEASLKSNDLARAEALFKQVAKLNPDDTRARTFLAVGQVSKGDLELGVRELRSISAKEQSVAADLALITSLMGKKEFDRALEAIKILENKQPGRPDGANLRGQIELQRGNKDKARQAFEAAFKIDPQSVAAAKSLADLDLLSGQAALAIERFDRMVAESPKNLSARMGAIGLRMQTGIKKTEAMALLQEAHKVLPGELAPRLELIRLYLEAKESPKALALAQDTLAQLPGRPESMEAMGRVLMDSGDLNQAEAMFSKWAVAQPKSVQPALWTARIQMARKNPQAAIGSLKKALQANPGNLDVQSALVAVLTGAGQADEARRIAASVQSARPREAAGFALAGDVAAFQKDWAAAIRQYRQGVELEPRRSDVAIKLFKALVAANDPAAAQKYVAERMKAYPNDAIFAFYQGDVALGKSDFEQAEKWYGDVLKLQPENVAALNNLAWLHIRSKKQARALEYAERANQLQPNSPGVMDTLAEVHASAGDFKKAVEVQRQVVELDARLPEYRLHLAKYLGAAGQKDAARAELKRLAETAPDFVKREEVRQLERSL